MKQIIRLIIISGITIFIICLGLYLYSPADFKMRLFRFWGYFTLRNNPLIEILDSDTSDIKSFRLSKHKMFAGGPPKDGIPSIDNPTFVNIKDSKFPDSEIVIGVAHNGVYKAYPYGILNWHEIVNDEIDGLPIAVTLCPLCDTNPVFIRQIAGVTTTFGVSGKLYQSCLIMYDRYTDSLWLQPIGIAVAGELVNKELSMIPGIKTTLGKWKAAHPDSLILSEDTGFRRNYFSYPYGSYMTDKNLYFPIDGLDKIQTHPKEIITYIYKNDSTFTEPNIFRIESKYFVNSKFERVGSENFTWLGSPAIAKWDPDFGAVRIYSNDEEIPSSTAFSFIYPAFLE